MKARIKAGVILFKDNKLLLVRHRHQETGEEWWVVPGGGLKDAETLEEGAQREIKEETGLTADIIKPVFLRQFIYHELQWNMIEVFFLAKNPTGELRHSSTFDEDEENINHARFVSYEEAQTLNLLPTYFKRLWDEDLDTKTGVTFIGTETDKDS